MRYLITGGTGSLGRALCKRLSKDNVVCVLSRDEQKHYRMAQSGSYKQENMRYFVGDVRDFDRVQQAMTGVDVVIHAAAMKHVPICEYNPYEAVATNILGTQNVARAAAMAGVRTVIGVSTDKAVAPINLYGATKLAAEKVLLASRSMNSRTKYVAVRYGNVMGSEGSVLPLWVSQLTRGEGPTITDRRMTRFMITMQKAVDTIVDALGMAATKDGCTIVPKLRSVAMADLADGLTRTLCRDLLSSRTTEIRPGEKLHEVLIDPLDSYRTEDCGDYYVVHPEDLKTPGVTLNYSSDNPEFLLPAAEAHELAASWFSSGASSTHG